LNFVESAPSFGANAQGADSSTVADAAGSRFELVSKIAITSTRDNPTGTPLFNQGEIYLIDPDGGNPQRLTSNTSMDALPMLSPDGKNIVFDSNRLTWDPADPRTLNISDLFVMELTPRVYSAEATGFLPGIEQTLLTRGSSATWSPDSKNIAFHASASYYASGGMETGIPTRSDPGAATTDSDIFVANVEELAAAGDVPTKTQLATNITNTPDQIEDDADWSASPTTAPGGQSIVFTSHPVTDNRRLSNQAEIYVINPDGTGKLQLTDNGHEERGPAWSPDGTRIVFSGRIGGGSNDFEICVMNADGTGFQQLTNNTVNDLGASWSPDGEQIAFHRESSNVPAEIYTMNSALNPDGSLPEAAPVTDPLLVLGLNRDPQFGEVRTRVEPMVPGDLGALPGGPDHQSEQNVSQPGGIEDRVSQHVLGFLLDRGVEHRGIGSLVSDFVQGLHGVTPGGPDQSATNEAFLSDGAQPANVALLGQYTAASFVGPAGAFGGTPTYDSPPAATLAQTLAQPLHS
jgi:TolB protein